MQYQPQYYLNITGADKKWEIYQAEDQSDLLLDLKE